MGLNECRKERVYEKSEQIKAVDNVCRYLSGCIFHATKTLALGHAAPFGKCRRSCAA